MQPWSLMSWQSHDYQQAPTYSDQNALAQVVDKISGSPPLVNPHSIHQLKIDVAKAGRGQLFILQGGDCAESFSDCNTETIRSKLTILSQMSLILQKHLDMPIIRIGRMAGQFAKPRSATHETINGMTLPSYRGDLINSPALTLEARVPNPQLLWQGYQCAASTLAIIKTLLANDPNPFYTSHEALHLHYEQALTRQDNDGHWYNLSTHLPWIGMRTATPDSAHLELLRGVQNPIGIKLGPHVTPDYLCHLLQILNPHNEEGRILLISRMGVNYIEQHLPPLIQAVQKAAIPVTWSCDPMHGNTEITAEGLKTRHFDTIVLELQRAVAIHQALGSYLGGVHFELTGEHVTECVGGSHGLTVDHLKQAYFSLVDPRLNYEQSLEMASALGLMILRAKFPDGLDHDR